MENEKKDNPILPDHYHAGGIDVFTFIEANLSPEKVEGYHQCSAIKYVIRAGKKGSASEDYQKAAVHVENLIRIAKKRIDEEHQTEIQEQIAITLHWKKKAEQLEQQNRKLIKTVRTAYQSIPKTNETMPTLLILENMVKQLEGRYETS